MSASSGGDLEGTGDDPRWQLVERISETEPFRKSPRFRELLRYLVTQTLNGHPETLTEKEIGHAVFSKPADYSPTEDSTVRVHVRQLRLKLHEYFDTVGRDETIFLEIPKGAFVPVIHENRPLDVPGSQGETTSISEPNAPHRTPLRRWHLPFLFAWGLLIGASSVVLLNRQRPAPAAAAMPWPLWAVTNPSMPTIIVGADANDSMIDILLDRHRSLQEYIQNPTVGNLNLKGSNFGQKHLFEYIGASSLTSSADAVIATKLANLLGTHGLQLNFRSARDLRPRDFDSGDFIILGSFTSNPWSSMFQDRLNFAEIANQSSMSWKNKAPMPGEQNSYECLAYTGSAGFDYADIALLPGQGGHDSVLLLQGCTQEGTESTLPYLVTENGRRDLLQALGLSGPPTTPVYFEALIKTEVIAGAPGQTAIVATRMIHPKTLN